MRARVRFTAPLLASLALILGAGCARPTPSGRTPTAITPTSATATPVPVVSVSDASIAGALTVAYIRGDDVWVSVRGASPEQVTHFGLTAPPTVWRLVWSSDQTRLLVVGSKVWIVALPQDTVTPLPSAALLADCAYVCSWLGDRYIVYPNLAGSTAHAQSWSVYDTQARRALATRLASRELTEVEVRGGDVYGSVYAWSDSGPQRATIVRYNLAANTLVTAFTVPTALVSQGLPVGGWDLSADGSRLVVSSLAPSGPTTACLNGPCYSYFMNTPTHAVPIFGQQHPDIDLSSRLIAIASDASHAGMLVGDSLSSSGGVPAELLQQPLPSGSVLTNALPVGPQAAGANQPQSYGTIAGWVAQPAGLLVQQTRVDARENPTSTDLYFAPEGTSDAAHLVVTIESGTVAVATPGA